MFIRRRSGTTLPELVLALALIGIITLLGSVAFSSARDVLAVRAARDAIIAASARTRAFAVGHGGASLHIDGVDGTLRIQTRDHAIDESIDIARSLAVKVTMDGARASTSAT